MGIIRRLTRRFRRAEPVEASTDMHQVAIETLLGKGTPFAAGLAAEIDRGRRRMLAPGLDDEREARLRARSAAWSADRARVRQWQRRAEELRAGGATEPPQRTSTPADDAAVLRMLNGAKFGPGCQVVLPTGRVMAGDEAALWADIENSQSGVSG